MSSLFDDPYFELLDYRSVLMCHPSWEKLEASGYNWVLEVIKPASGGRARRYQSGPRRGQSNPYYRRRHTLTVELRRAPRPELGAWGEWTAIASMDIHFPTPTLMTALTQMHAMVYQNTELRCHDLLAPRPPAPPPAAPSSFGTSG
jgi:hypothetical protein